MAVLNGTVDIRISTKSEGNAAAGVRAVAKEVDALDKTSVAARNPIAALGSGLMALKDGVSPVENIKSAVDSLTGTFAFAGGAIGIVGSIVGTLVGVLATAESATAKLIRQTEEASAKSHDHAQALTEQGKAAIGAAENMRDLQASVLSAMAANATSQGDTDAAFSAQMAAAMELSGKAIEDVTDKIARLSTEQNNLVFKSNDLTAEIDKQQQELDELASAYGRVNSAGELVVDRSTELGRAMADVIVQRRNDIATMREQRAAQLARVDAIDGEIEANKRLREERATAAEEAGVIMMEEMTFTPRRRAGGVSTRQREQEAQERAQRAFDQQRAQERGRAWLQSYRDEIEAYAEEVEAEEQRHEAWAAIHRARVGDSFRVGAEDSGKMAATIRDFSSALGESIPQMTEFAGALATVASSWDGVAAANDNVMQVEARWREGKATERDLLEATTSVRKAEAKAAIDSVGALAKAGAEQIKNERLRAGVLAIIETGLSIASFAAYDYVGGAAHAAAALVLGSVALFSGGSKGGSRNQQGSRTQQLSSGPPQPTQSITQVNVYGGWYGGQSAQENAWALEQTTRRHAGNGFARAA